MRSQPEIYFLRDNMQVYAVEGNGVFVIGEHARWHTNSALVTAVLNAVDGRRDVAGILAELPGFGAAEVHYVLGLLRSNGVVETRAEKGDEKAQPEWVRRAVGPVILTSKHSLSLNLMEEALRSQRVSDVTEIQSNIHSEIEVLLVSDYLAEDAVAAMDASRGRGRLTLPVKLAGERSYFGPEIGFRSSLCLDCFREGLRANRPLETHLHLAMRRPFGPGDAREIGCPSYAVQTAEDVAKKIKGFLTDPAGHPVLCDIVERGPDGQRLHRADLHTCPGCCVELRQLGSPSPHGHSQTVQHRLGGYRTRDPQALVSELSPLVSDLTGFISSIGPLETGTAADGSAKRHVWAAAYPVRPRRPKPGADDFHGTALGKGIEAKQAEASAICEAVERISAHYRPSLQPVRASHGSLAKEAFHPNDIWLFSDQQYCERDAWNELTADDRRHVPAPVCSDLKIDWMPVWSLTSQRQKFLPLDLCFANAPEPRIGRFDPNGCAAGAALVEAGLQGFLELVERDCIALWWYNRIRRPAIDPVQDGDERLRRLASTFHDQGWNCWLLDLTSDLQIPCFAALARANADGRWCIGFGCHFEGAIAMERAMTELGQLFRADGRDGPPPWTGLEDEETGFLLPHGQASIRDAPVGSATNLEDILQWCVQCLAERNIELLMLDQTHPDIGLPVVKMFAPGLRHFWPRFAPGRLFDVPVQMGWLRQPTEEKDLNHSHLFL